MIFVWLPIGVGIYYFIKNNGTSDAKHINSRTPEDILKERYVNGEIDEITFERMTKTLNS
jgi:putative membrane protein